MSARTLRPETPDQRKARQYSTLHTLAELGLELAKLSQAKAVKQITHSRAPDQPDYAATFASLSRAVRQAIALEIRLDAPARTRPSFRVATRASDPRRPLLRRVFHDALHANPDPATRREINTHIDHLLDADPDHQTPIDDIIATLCDAHAVQIDLSRVPDELLDLISPPPPPHPTPPSRAAP